MIRLNHHADGFAIAKETVSFNPAVDRVVARADSRGLLGGVIYQQHTGASIAMHVAGFHKHWLTRDLLWVLFHYPFVQLGCKKVIGYVPSSNQKALDFDLKIGFKQETSIKDVFRDGDLLVLSMTREDCRWLAIKPKGIKWDGQR